MFKKIIFVGVSFLINSYNLLLAQDEIFQNGFEPVPELFLAASPEYILPGDTSTITWSVINADNCVKSGDWSGVAQAGTGIYNNVVMPVNLPAVYSMQCSNSFGLSPVRSVVVGEVVSNPPTLTFVADPTELLIGEITTLNWFVNDATSCTASVISGSVSSWSGVVNSSDGLHSRIVTANVLPTTLNLICQNAAGIISQSLLLTEKTTTTVPPNLTLTANPTTVAPGDITFLSWQSTNADQCTAISSPTHALWIGNKATNGTMSIGVPVSTTFSMICSNTNGAVTKSVTVDVYEALN